MVMIKPASATAAAAAPAADELLLPLPPLVRLPLARPFAVAPLAGTLPL